MQAYFCKLVPPRPTFAQDMSDREAAIMDEHASYWHARMDEGKVLVFGPVADPAGLFGMGIIEVKDEQEGRSFMDNDPAVRSGLVRYELHPMPQGAIRPTVNQTAANLS